MPSLTNAAAQLHAAGLPVLFMDTCSVVDVIRGPIRPDKLRGCVEAAVELTRTGTFVQAAEAAIGELS